MNRFSEVLQRGGLGYNFQISADVTMQNEQKFSLSFTVNALNKDKAIKEAYTVLEEAKYVTRIHSVYEPKQLV